MKTESFPLTITEKDVSAVIRTAEKIKGGTSRNYFIVEYFLNGKRKQVWRADEVAARAVTKDACFKISNGDQSSLELRNGDLLAYNRAVEILALSRIEIDTACREYTDALQILGGKVSITEACREWLKIHAVQLPRITVADAAELLNVQTESDGKSHARQKTISAALDALADKFNVQVHTITPGRMNIIARPPYESVPLETGLRWNQSQEMQFTEKLDGCRNEICIGQSVIVGELMAAHCASRTSTSSRREQRRNFAATADRLRALWLSVVSARSKIYEKYLKTGSN